MLDPHLLDAGLEPDWHNCADANGRPYPAMQPPPMARPLGQHHVLQPIKHVNIVDYMQPLNACTIDAGPWAPLTYMAGFITAFAPLKRHLLQPSVS